MGTIKLYYGASSNFSFLQHIYRSLVCRSSQTNHTSDPEVQEGGPGLDYFHQRQSYFGPTPTRLPQEMRMDFLTLDCANILVRSYTCTLDHLVPIWTELELLGKLAALHGQLQHGCDFLSLENTILLCILAIGAATAEHFEWAEILYVRAKSDSVLLNDVVNLQAVQISLLMVRLIEACLMLKSDLNS